MSDEEIYAEVEKRYGILGVYAIQYALKEWAKQEKKAAGGRA